MPTPPIPFPTLLHASSPSNYHNFDSDSPNCSLEMSQPRRLSGSMPAHTSVPSPFQQGYTSGSPFDFDNTAFGLDHAATTAQSAISPFTQGYDPASTFVPALQLGPANESGLSPFSRGYQPTSILGSTDAANDWGNFGGELQLQPELQYATSPFAQCYQPAAILATDGLNSDWNHFDNGSHPTGLHEGMPANPNIIRSFTAGIQPPAATVTLGSSSGFDNYGPQFWKPLPSIASAGYGAGRDLAG